MGGGIDSTAMLLDQTHRFNSLCVALHFDYGQKAAFRELSAIRWFCDKYNVPLKSIRVPLYKIATSNILQGMPAKTNKLEGRNAVFVMLGATYAATIDYDHVMLGIPKEPARPFPDCTKVALSWLDGCVSACYGPTIRVSSPLIEMDRTEVLRMGYARDPDIIEKSHTCYEDRAGGCGTCIHCRQRAVMIGNLLNKTNNPLPENF